MGRKDKLPKIILFLSMSGIMISVYLSVQHYVPSSGAFCDFGEHVSCSLVNNSVYSELFGIPVAFLGVLWFSVSSFISGLALKKRKKAQKFLLAWSALGASFVFYLIYVEFILRAVCPFCLVIQAMVFSILLMSLAMVQKQ